MAAPSSHGYVRCMLSQMREVMVEYRFLVLAVAPALYLLAVDTGSFSLGWNVGRGGLLFAAMFLGVEYWDERKFLPPKIAGFRARVPTILIALSLLFFTGKVFLGLSAVIGELGRDLGLSLLLSWVWMWDYLAYLAYLSLLMVTFFGLSVLRKMLTPLLYLGGMTAVLAMDAIFPFDYLGPLQFAVPYILGSVAGIIHAFKLGSVFIDGNLMTLSGQFGTFRLSVYWPSAGVHGMLIYTLIMIAFMAKMKMSRMRKAIYYVIGAAGTVSVNILRITLLAAYLLLFKTDLSSFEEFHAIAGELLFLPWVFLYVLGVTWIESRNQRRNQC